MRLTKEQKLTLKNIAELIEDQDFPAKRVIADYAIQLLPFELNKQATDFMEKQYKLLGTIKG